MTDVIKLSDTFCLRGKFIPIGSKSVFGTASTVFLLCPHAETISVKHNSINFKSVILTLFQFNK